MPERKPKRGEATRETILRAAEEEFGQYGYAGARVDRIAESAGFNKTLIFRYFNDKEGLYIEVLKRADLEARQIFAPLFLPLLEDETLASDAVRFREYLKTTLCAFFDYMVAHPNFTRVLNWEQSEGWKNFRRAAARLENDDFARLEQVFARGQAAGQLRPELDLPLAIVLIQQICWSIPNMLPLYQLFADGSDLSSAAGLAHLREQIVGFLVAGMMGALPGTNC